MHSIPLDEEDDAAVADPLGPAMEGRSAEDVLGDLRGHVLAGRYVLFELLGSGELGCVYAGRDQPTGQIVAVKVLATGAHREVVAATAERARQRFGIRHPQVAAVLAEGSLGTLWYAAMEHVSGQNFYHAQGDPRLEGAGLPTLGAALAEGLAALHAAGAAHGAVSPGNLLWEAGGEPAVRVRLVDLDVSMTEGAGVSDPSPSDDVRALAGVLLELAAGRESEPWVQELGPIARGEARVPAAELAARLRAAAVSTAIAAESPKVAEPPKVAESAAPAEETDATPAPPPFGVAAPVPEEAPRAGLADAVSLALSAAREAATAAATAASSVTSSAASSVAASSSPASSTSLASEPALVTSTPTAVSLLEEDDEATEAVGEKRGGIGAVVIGALIVAALCAVAAWQLQAWNAAREAAPAAAPAPEVAPEVAPKRADLSPGTSTLASVAAPAEEAAAAAGPRVMPEGSAPAEAREPGEGTSESEQLSAREFRRVMLRASRGEAVRNCFVRHGDRNFPDVEVVALIGPSGRPQRVRIGEGELADCLRKIVIALDFPPAQQAAQHNFVFHYPRE